MKIIMHKIVFSALFATLTLLASAGTGYAASYTFTAFDVPGASTTIGCGINDKGQIAGSVDITQFYGNVSFPASGFLKSGDTYTLIKAPNAIRGTNACGLNNSGAIVGAFIDSYEEYGYLLSGNSYSSIIFPGMSNSNAGGISDSGAIVGTKNVGAVDSGYIRGGGVDTIFSYPNDNGTTNFRGISSDGTKIVGTIRSTTGYHGFLKVGDALTPIDVPGAISTVTSGVNNAGQIVGGYSVISGISHGFIWDHGVVTTIDYPGAVATSIQGINNLGQVTGSFRDSQGITHGFVANPSTLLFNVRVVETLSNVSLDVDLTSFTTQPYSITDVGNQKIIEWHFDAFSTTSTQALGFDVIFKNPVAGENRLISYKVDLFYNDVNGNPVTTELDPQYVGVYQSTFQVAPATDKVSYGANDIVQISTVAKNIGATTAAVSVRLSIKDANNVLVTTLGTTSAQTVAAGNAVTFTGLNFPVGSTIVGNYQVVAELLDSTGNVIATGSMPFTIVNGNGVSTLSANLTSDKQSYQANDTVKLAERLVNTTVNAPLNNVTIVTSASNPDGTLRFTHTESLVQLIQGALKDYSYNMPLNGAPAGQYSATMVATAPDGTVLAQAATTFAVVSSATSGSGLTGSLTLSAKQVPVGDSLAFSFTANNVGNSMLTNLPLKVDIVDPAAQKVVAEFPYSLNLPIGANANSAANWITSGPVGTTYVAVLSAQVGTNTLTLAQASFTLIEPPIKLDIKQTIANGNRVLVLVSCNDGEDDSIGKDGKPPVCQTQRTQIIDQALTALGVTHTITTNETDFTQAFRSGLYNTYWISGKEDKLHDELTEEIREAAYSGDGVILDGVHDQRNKVLDTVAGITWKGKIGETNLAADISGSLFTAQRLATVGRSDRMDLNGSVQQAVLYGSQQTTAYGPAIVSNTYGNGHAITYAFDLPTSLQAQAAWQGNVANALQAVLPTQPAILTPGAVLPVKTSVTNQANAVDVDVNSTLSTGSSYLSSNPSGTYSAANNSIDWQFHLPAAQSQDLFLTMRVPGTAGNTTLQTIVSTVKNGTTKPYGNPLTLPITVTASAQTSADAIAALQAFNLTTNQDSKLRDSLVSQLQAAMAAFQLNTQAGYETAIDNLIQVADQLSGLTSVDTRAVHDDIDRLLKEAQWRWSMAPAVTK